MVRARYGSSSRASARLSLLRACEVLERATPAARGADSQFHGRRSLAEKADELSIGPSALHRAPSDFDPVFQNLDVGCAIVADLTYATATSKGMDEYLQGPAASGYAGQLIPVGSGLDHYTPRLIWGLRLHFLCLTRHEDRAFTRGPPRMQIDPFSELGRAYGPSAQPTDAFTRETQKPRTSKTH